jgi:hypothetical protein
MNIFFGKNISSAKQCWRQKLETMQREQQGYIDSGAVIYKIAAAMNDSKYPPAFGNDLINKHDHVHGAYVIGGHLVQFVSFVDPIEYGDLQVHTHIEVFE